MIRIESKPWQEMVAHACSVYPDECCGAMLGTRDGEGKHVSRVVPLENVSAQPHRTHYEIRPSDMPMVEKKAQDLGLSVVGIYHSHPDRAAAFSETDIRNSCPWFSFLVLSVHNGLLEDANCWAPDDACTAAEKETIEVIP